MKTLVLVCCLIVAILNANAEEVLVLIVPSGNTFRGYSKNGSIKSYRLLNVADPQKQIRQQPQSRESELFLNQMIGGKRVDVELKGGRGDAIVTFEGRSINLEIIRSGYGLFEPADGESKVLREAEETARRDGKGLWPVIEQALERRRLAKELAARNEAKKHRLEKERARRVWVSKIVDALIPGVDYHSDIFARTELRIAMNKQFHPATGRHLYFSDLANFKAIVMLNGSWEGKVREKVRRGRLYAISAQEKTVSIIDQNGQVFTFALEDPSLTTQDLEARVYDPILRYHLLLSSIFLRLAREEFTEEESEQIITACLGASRLRANENPQLIAESPEEFAIRLGAHYLMFGFQLEAAMGSRRDALDVRPQDFCMLIWPGYGSGLIEAAYEACLQGRQAGESVDQSLKVLEDEVKVDALYRSALIKASESS